MTVAVEVHSLRKAYAGRAVVDDVSFTVASGEVFGILGPNGAGKTTTVEILEGYRTPDAGRAAVLGLDPRRDHRRLRGLIGVMLQEGGVYPGIRPLEALRLFAAYYDDPADPDELLDAVGLRDVAGTTVRRLSGGQQQRLSLALALVGRPQVAFLDEPTAGMDPHARAATWQVVEDLRERGTTVVFTTHAMDEAEHLADRLAIIDRGRLVALGTPAELTADAGAGDMAFSAAPGLDTGALGATLGAPVTEERPGRYRVAAPADPQTVAALTAWLAERGVTLGDLHAGRRSLEDVFLRLTSETWPPDPRFSHAKKPSSEGGDR